MNITFFTVAKNGIIFIKNKLNNGLTKKELNITMDKLKKTWEIEAMYGYIVLCGYEVMDFDIVMSVVGKIQV